MLAKWCPIQLEASIGLCPWPCIIQNAILAYLFQTLACDCCWQAASFFGLSCNVVGFFQWVSCIRLKDLADAMDSFEKDLVGDLSSTVVRTSEMCATAKTPAIENM